MSQLSEEIVKELLSVLEESITTVSEIECDEWNDYPKLAFMQGRMTSIHNIIVNAMKKVEA